MSRARIECSACNAPATYRCPQWRMTLCSVCLHRVSLEMLGGARAGYDRHAPPDNVALDGDPIEAR